jgi:two-component system, NtrC family, nitrogen regulation response regulator GlnG
MISSNNNNRFVQTAKTGKSGGNTILIADDDASIRTVLSQALARSGFQVRSTSNASTLWKWVKDNEGDLVLTDVMMPDGSVFDFLPRIRAERPKLPIIVMSAQNTLLTAISAAEQGAYEYLPKPFDLEKLIDLVKRALSPVAEHRAVVQKRRAQNDESLPLLGRSNAMQEVYRTLSRVAPSDLTVLVEGEVGVGKKLIAKTIHDFSARKNGPFKIINVAGFSDTFELEQILLGRSLQGGGLIEEIADGTLVLDGIDDAPITTQARLASIINSLGENAPRIIATGSESLREALTEGALRKDLYHLLNVINIKVPPLRERLSDIGDLARLFLGRAAKEGLSEKILEKGAIDELETWVWPGNVRELENLMRRICALNSEATITTGAISAAMVETISVPKPSTGNSEEDLTGAARNAFINYFARAKSEGQPIIDLYSYAIRSVEKPLFELTLKETRGNQIRAAELLGLNRNTLRKRLSELNIQ